MPETLFNIRIDDEDRALLEECAAREKLTKSDIVRRAIRAYATALGIGADAKQRTRRKK